MRKAKFSLTIFRIVLTVNLLAQLNLTVWFERTADVLLI